MSLLARKIKFSSSKDVRRDSSRGFRTPREAEGVDRINVATRPETVGVAAAHVQVVSTEMAKGRRGRLCAASKHPGHLVKSRWLFWFLS